MLVASAPALADPARPADVRLGLGIGYGENPQGSFDRPSGVTGGAMVDAGWWVSDHLTFGMHVGLGIFSYSSDDASNTPHHTAWRYSYLQPHATFLAHWGRFVAGGGVGFDISRRSYLEADGMSRSETDSHFSLGVHAQVGVDIVRVGPGMLGAFGIVTRQPIALEERSVPIASVLGGLSYAFAR